MSNKGRCFLCGAECNRIHNHHIDYGKDVTIPLCPSCHMLLHTRIDDFPELSPITYSDDDEYIKIEFPKKYIKKIESFMKYHRLNMSKTTFFILCAEFYIGAYILLNKFRRLLKSIDDANTVVKELLFRTNNKYTDENIYIPENHKPILAFVGKASPIEVDIRKFKKLIIEKATIKLPLEPIKEVLTREKAIEIMEKYDCSIFVEDGYVHIIPNVYLTIIGEIVNIEYELKKWFVRNFKYILSDLAP